VNSTAAILHRLSKTGPLHYCNEILQQITKWTAIQRENVNRGCIASIITISVQNGVPLHGHKPRESSPFVNRLINNCLLLYPRPDRTQTLLHLFVQMFQKIVQSRTDV